MSADPISQKASDSCSDQVWIERGDIAQVTGALKPGAYVARAYLILKESGAAPAWARKTSAGKWQFRRAYIQCDAQRHQQTIGISEAAEHLGTSRRTIQTWVDDGILQAHADERTTGEFRRINRSAFLKAVPDLKARLPPEPSRKVALPSPFDERLLSQGDRKRIASLRKRAADAKARREAVQKEIRLAEKAAGSQNTVSTRFAAKIEKLRRQFGERLAVLQKAQSYADRKRVAELERAKRLSRKVGDMQLREIEIGNALDERLALSKRQQAEALSLRLEQARRADGPTDTGMVGTVERVRSASRRVGTGSAENVDPDIHLKAERIAETLMGDVEAGLLDHIDAAIRFNTAAERDHIPHDVRIAVTRAYFSHGS